MFRTHALLLGFGLLATTACGGASRTQNESLERISGVVEIPNERGDDTPSHPRVHRAPTRPPTPALRCETQAEPPRSFVDTRYVPPTEGRRFRVQRGGDLQGALDAVRPGDVLELEAGATFSGNYHLRAKRGPGAIHIQSSALSSLPDPGERVGPGDAANMPKIVTPNTAPALVVDAGAKNYRLIGVEITGTHRSRSSTLYNLVRLSLGRGGRAATRDDEMADNIVFDRIYLHGTPTGNVRTGIALDAKHVAVIDSHLSDFHETGRDSQAILVTNGVGPTKIVNNHLEGAGENIMFGGGDPAIPGLIPEDVEIRNNYLLKPLTWKADDPSFSGVDWSIKNLFELKNARRVLVVGNVLRNNWVDSQNGTAVLFTVRNQGGTAPHSAVQDVTFLYNVIENSRNGFLITGTDDLQRSAQSRRIAICDNALLDIENTHFVLNTGDVDKPIEHLTIAHNTLLHRPPGGSVAFIEEPAPGVSALFFRNNVTTHGRFGFSGSGVTAGTATVEAHVSGATFEGNVLWGAVRNDPNLYPGGNFHPQAEAEVEFVDAASGDYRLGPASPFRRAGTDGMDPGVDWETLRAQTSCVVDGTCGSD